MSVTIGKILKPVGLQGELKIRLLTDFPDRFESIEEIWLQTRAGDRQRCQIARLRYGPPFVYLTFEGLTSREAVAHLQGATLQIPEAERISLPKGMFFQSDLIGLDVYLEDGGCLGKIEEIIETGTHDVFVVRNMEKEVLIPALQDIFLEVDLKNKRMTVDPPKGLLAL